MTSPNEIANLNLWLDSSDSSTLFKDAAQQQPAVADADLVMAWRDKSGNNRHFTAASSAVSPQLKPNSYFTLNNKPGILFDGVNDYISGACGLSGTAHHTVFCVWKIWGRNGSSDVSIITLGDRSNRGQSGTPAPFFGYPYMFNNANKIGYRSSYADYPGTQQIFPSPIFCARKSATNHKVGNGAGEINLTNTTSTLNLASGAMEIGRGSIFDSTAYTNMVLYEVIVYSRYLEDSERESVMAYLGDKYGSENRKAYIPEFNGSVRTVINDGNTAYASGAFTSVNGVTGFTGLAKFNLATGIVDTTWKPAGGNTPYAIALSPDKTAIFVGGQTSTPYLRKYLVNSNTAQPFVTTSDIVNGLIMDGNDLYVFKQVFGSGSTATSLQGTFVRPGCVKIDVTGNSGQGSIDTQFVQTASSNTGTVVYNAVAQDSNYIYLGGNFTKWDNQTANYIVKINKSDAKIASDWVGGTGFNGQVFALLLGSNNSLYASASTFTTYKGVNTSGQIVKLDKQGTRDTGYTSFTVSGGVTTLAKYNSALYAGTQFNTATASISTGIVKSTNLSTFTKDGSFLTATGFGTSGRIGYINLVANNLFLSTTATTTYQGSSGIVWPIDKTTAAVTSMISNSALPASFSLTSFAANQSVTATILKDAVSNQAKVQAHGTLSNANSWRWIVLVYTKSTGGKHYEGFDARLGSPTGKIKTSLAGGTTLTFSHLFVVNAARQSVKILASDIENASNLNLSVTA